MKPLTKYLNPKSQWHPSKGFPETPKLDDVLEFLRDQKFYELDYDSIKNGTIEEFIKKTKELHKPIFTYSYSGYSSDIYWVRMSNGKTINENNPIFGVFLTIDGSLLDNNSSLNYIGWYGETPNFSGYDITTYQDFLDKINSHFEWK